MEITTIGCATKDEFSMTNHRNGSTVERVNERKKGSFVRVREGQGHLSTSFSKFLKGLTFENSDKNSWKILCCQNICGN
jgi:dTDP-4-dehydrorhamnose 3,5-epimerase-like enzyme